MPRIYLDHHATTPVDPRVLHAMLPYFTEKFGNAASRNHIFGREAAQAVEEARAKVAQLVGARPDEIVFTSGATESDNLAIQGAVVGRHVVTVVTEHRAVLDPCRRRGHATFLPVDRFGILDLEVLKAALTNETGLVSVMAANNEIGVLQPIAEIGRICKERGILFHSDAAQAAGKVSIDVEAMEIDLLSVSAHKIYGPKGVGALYVRKRNPRVRLTPILEGGGHEEGLRSGTLPVPLIVGFGEAAAICRREMAEEAERIRGLRDRLQEGIFDALDFVTLNGHPEKRLPGNLNVSFEFVESESLIQSLGEIAVSSGAACMSAKLEPSYVLHALGVPEPRAHGAIRFGLGRFNTKEEVDSTRQILVESVKELRGRSPLYRSASRKEV